jgi:hypothetical protein
MSAPDISSHDVLATYPHPIDNFVIHTIRNKYELMTMSTKERPPPNVCEAILYQLFPHAKDNTSIGSVSIYGGGFYMLSVLRISQTQFLVKFRPIAMD